MIEAPGAQRFTIPYIDQVLGVSLPPEFHLHYGYFEVPEQASEEDEYRLAQRRLVDVLFDALDTSSGTIVDIGCGLGGAIAHLDTRCRDAELVGLNIDARQLRIAEARVTSQRNRIRWVHADASAQLPFAEGSVAGMLSIECLPHVGSRRVLLEAAAAALCSGGRFAIADIETTPVLLQRGGAELDRLAQVIEAGFGPWPALRVAESTAVIGQAVGLSCVEQRNITPQILPSRRWMRFDGEDPKTAAIHAATDALHEMLDNGEMEYRLVILQR